MKRHFRSYIEDSSAVGVKGPLPGKSDLLSFLKQNPILGDQPDTKRFDILKTKTFNEGKIIGLYLIMCNFKQRNQSASKCEISNYFKLNRFLLLVSCLVFFCVFLFFLVIPYRFQVHMLSNFYVKIHLLF